jgi:hypothetical protein
MRPRGRQRPARVIAIFAWAVTLVVPSPSLPETFVVSGPELQVRPVEPNFILGEPIRLEWILRNPGSFPISVIPPSDSMCDIGAVAARIDVIRPDGQLLQVRALSHRATQPRSEEYERVPLEPGGSRSGIFVLVDRGRWGVVTSEETGPTHTSRVFQVNVLDTCFDRPGRYALRVELTTKGPTLTYALEPADGGHLRTVVRGAPNFMTGSVAAGPVVFEVVAPRSDRPGHDAP